MTQLELRRMLAEQERLIAQKDSLFQELHHRVKNNLAMVSGFLALQGRQAGDPQVRDALGEAQQRIMTVARLHDRLQSTGAVDRVAFGSFLRQLIDDLARSFSEPRGTRIKAGTIVDVPMITKDAVPTALMINELATNALRHGRPNGGALDVTISMTREDAGRVAIEVVNDGEPLPEGYDPKKNSGLGMRMILAFVDQLGGKLETKSGEGGVCFRISLPPRIVGEEAGPPEAARGRSDQWTAEAANPA